MLQEGRTDKFIYPSYVQDIMGDIFSLGFGPFRWVCTSCDPEDLRKTDKIAEEVIQELFEITPKDVRFQFQDNLKWIQQAEENRLVVGSQARILYSDTQGRTKIALRFNEAIRKGHIKGTICLSRDHHDVSGTDSPFRETSNIYDGSQWTADMAIQNVIGDSFRGATWVSIHNGGGKNYRRTSAGRRAGRRNRSGVGERLPGAISYFYSCSYILLQLNLKSITP